MRRQLPEEPHTLETEYRAPYPVQVHGYYGDIEAVGYPFKALFEGQEVACPGDGALREYADQVVRLELFPGRGKGLQDLSFVAVGYRYGLHELQQPLYGLYLVEVLVDHEPYEPLHARADEEGVDKGHVIGDKHGRALYRHILLADYLYLVEGVREHPEDESEEKIRQGHEHPDGSKEGQHPEQEDYPVGRDREGLGHDPEHAGSQEYATGVDEVVRGYYPAFFICPALLLKKGI